MQQCCGYWVTWHPPLPPQRTVSLTSPSSRARRGHRRATPDRGGTANSSLSRVTRLPCLYIIDFSVLRLMSLNPNIVYVGLHHSSLMSPLSSTLIHQYISYLTVLSFPPLLSHPSFSVSHSFHPSLTPSSSLTLQSLSHRLLANVTSEVPLGILIEAALPVEEAHRRYVRPVRTEHQCD